MSKPNGFLNSTLIATVAASGLILAALSTGGQANAGLSDRAPPPPGAETTMRPQAARCVNAQINRVSVVNDRTVMVTDDAGRSAVLTLSGPCMRDASAQIIIQLAPGTDSLCHPNDADLQVSLSGSIQQTCRITSVRQLRS